MSSPTRSLLILLLVMLRPGLVMAAETLEEGFGSTDNRHHLVSGDFNGDGYLDNAYASVIGDVWHLTVHLDVLAEVGEIVILDEHTPDVPVEEIRLEVRPPGCYLTFCGRAPGECEPSEPHRIQMPSDGILLQVLEASASLIYWDEAQGRFVRHWLSD